jgi:hypothetical protein
MRGFNLDRVNLGYPPYSLKSIVDEIEEIVTINRNGDRLLQELGMIDDAAFYANELAYSRVECDILVIKYGLAAMKH